MKLSNIESSKLFRGAQVITLLAAICLGGCDPAESADPQVEIASVAISFVPNTTIAKLGVVQLSVIAKDANGAIVSSPTLEWSSADPSILSVNSDGLVRGVGAGSSTVTVTSGSKSGSKDFTVYDLDGYWEGLYNGSSGIDTIRYVLQHTASSLNGTFRSDNGFPPITNNNTGTIKGKLDGDLYTHTVTVPASPCNLQFEAVMKYSLQSSTPALLPQGTAPLSSNNCSDLTGRISLTSLYHK